MMKALLFNKYSPKQASALVKYLSTITTTIHDPPEYIFIDNHVLSAYAAKKNIPFLIPWMDEPHRLFFYTETVKSKAEQAMSIHNHDDFHAKFKFIPSGIPETLKQSAYFDLFHHVHHLNAEQEAKWRNDAYILFEACFSCFDKGVAPPGDLTWPYFLTNNMQFMKQFLSTPRKQQVMEIVINTHGFEHLMEVKTVEEVLGMEMSRMKENTER